MLHTPPRGREHMVGLCLYFEFFCWFMDICGKLLEIVFQTKDNFLMLSEVPGSPRVFNKYPLFYKGKLIRKSRKTLAICKLMIFSLKIIFYISYHQYLE